MKTPYDVEIDLIDRFCYELCEKMKECYKRVLYCGGNSSFSVYIDETGDIVTEEYAGNRCMRWLSKDYYHIVDISIPFFDPSDFSENPDETEIDEIIDYCVESYEPYDILRNVLYDLERDRDYYLFDPNF